MYGNTYPAFYYFVIQANHITPAEYDVVEYENTDGEFSLAEAREELEQSFVARPFPAREVLCVACDIDDAYDIINNAIDLDEMLLGDQN